MFATEAPIYIVDLIPFPVLVATEVWLLETQVRLDLRSVQRSKARLPHRQRIWILRDSLGGPALYNLRSMVEPLGKLYRIAHAATLTQFCWPDVVSKIIELIVPE